MRWLIGLVALCCAGCSATAPVNVRAHETCGPPLTRKALVSIVEGNLKIRASKYTFDITEKDCDYYVTAYLNGGPPDSQVFLVITREGKIKERIFGG